MMVSWLWFVHAARWPWVFCVPGFTPPRPHCILRTHRTFWICVAQPRLFRIALLQRVRGCTATQPAHRGIQSVDSEPQGQLLRMINRPGESQLAATGRSNQSTSVGIRSSCFIQIGSGQFTSNRIRSCQVRFCQVPDPANQIRSRSGSR